MGCLDVCLSLSASMFLFCWRPFCLSPSHSVRMSHICLLSPVCVSAMLSAVCVSVMLSAALSANFLYLCKNVCISVSLSFYLSVFLSVTLSLSLNAGLLYIRLYFCLPLCLFARLYSCLSIWQSLCGVYSLSVVCHTVWRCIFVCW